MAQNKALEQLKEFAQKLTTGQKVLISASIILVLGSLFWIISSSGEERYRVLFDNLEPSDAAKITERLKTEGIDYELSNGGASVLVPEKYVYDTRLDMAAQGLPSSSTVGYELFDNSNLGMSEFVQKLNFRRALEGELSQTIQSFEEVKNARVHVVIPEKALFKRDQKDPTASVSLQLESGRSIGKISVEGIQNLVASSVEGMMPEKVKVVDQRARVLSETPLDQNTVAGLTDAQHSQQRRLEDYLETKVKSLLDGVIGEGNTQVSVNTDLDFTRIEQVITDFDPDEQVVRSEQNIKENSQTADSLSYPYVNMAKDEQNQIANYEISKSEERIIHEVGAVKRMTVSVMIDGVSQVVDNGNGPEVQYTPRTQEEMDQFTEIVKNAIGYNPIRNDQLSVINVPFSNNEDQFGIINEPEIPWYENPDNQKILFLLAAIILAVILMILLLNNKYLKERIRIALGLPDKIYVEDDFETNDESKLEEIDITDSNDLMLMPAELPEQLLMPPMEERLTMQDNSGNLVSQDADSRMSYDANAMASRSGAQLLEMESSEDQLLTLELKNRVEEFMDKQPKDAAKLLRIWLNSDKEMMYSSVNEE
ncbi:MAG: hypothetical protein Kapaf2KO_20220 [Candidatus Kapaibacteriales bacterium]